MKQIEVVAAIIQKDDRIFAIQRGYGDFKDWWEFPGGKMKAGKATKESETWCTVGRCYLEYAGGLSLDYECSSNGTKTWRRLGEGHEAGVPLWHTLSIQLGFKVNGSRLMVHEY